MAFKKLDHSDERDLLGRRGQAVAARVPPHRFDQSRIPQREQDLGEVVLRDSSLLRQLLTPYHRA